MNSAKALGDAATGKPSQCCPGREGRTCANLLFIWPARSPNTTGANKLSSSETVSAPLIRNAIYSTLTSPSIARILFTAGHSLSLAITVAVTEPECTVPAPALTPQIQCASVPWHRTSRSSACLKSIVNGSPELIEYSHSLIKPTVTATLIELGLAAQLNKDIAVTFGENLTFKEIRELWMARLCANSGLFIGWRLYDAWNTFLQQPRRLARVV